MREVELKSVVDDLSARRKQVELAGGKLSFGGKLIDRRYDSSNDDLIGRDHVLRLRVYESGGQREGHLDWKGETRYEDGYKVRDEISTVVGDPDSVATMLANLGFRVIREIEREIFQYSLAGAVVRFERYPRMDDLVEVEGSPEAIERAISMIGLPRPGFIPARLVDFTTDFETRTGLRAAVSAREMSGEYPLSRDSA
ncbi:MAG: class IV adenylate cyclase [Gemmatimonadaceae bacterium]